MGCAESVAVSRPSHNNSSTNTAKPRQVQKKRTQRRPSRQEQVLGELPQPGEFDPSQGQQEQRSRYSDDTSSGRSTQSRVSSRSNMSAVAPVRSGSLGPSSGAGVESNPLHGLLSILVVPDEDDEQPFFLSATSKDSGGTAGSISGASASTAIYRDETAVLAEQSSASIPSARTP